MSFAVRRARAGVLLAASLTAASLQAEPFLPSDDAEVLERLPAPDGPRMQEIASLSRTLAGGADRPELRIELARRYLALGRALSDPRFIGRAQGALGPLWAEERLPARVMVLRAAIRRAQHDFQGSLADLREARAQSPDNPQAQLDLATTLEALGEVAAMRDACRAALRLRPGLVGQACLANADSQSGAAAASYHTLETALAAAGDLDPSVRSWVLTLLGEMAWRQGDLAGAERHFTDALEAVGEDLYIALALADLLLDTGRPGAVLPLLENRLQVDAALLRWTIAARAVDDEDAEPRRRELATRFAAAERRGDKTHLRDAARFELVLERDAPAAVALAEANWQRQRGPADARILLEAAVAAGRPDAAAPVLAWLDRTGNEDVTLARLGAEISGDL